MTALEIINNQITILKSQLDIPGICVGCIEKQLEDLKKVKVDLEAWEVVKKYLFVDKNIFEEDWEEFEYEYIRFINENICPMHGSNFEEIDIIKKALEVK